MTLKVDRADLYWEFTRSLCPECKQVIDAQILFRDGQVIMRKRCPEHGYFEALIFGDSQLYVDIAPYNKPGTMPLEFATDVREGCPHDCGLCPDHQQHTCLGIIEVNSACNMDCPLCLANSGTHLAKTGFQLTLDQVNFMLDRFVATEGNPEVLQYSGGEPTLHPQILDFIALAKEKNIEHVMLNTNGIRIARDDRFLERLAELRPTIYLQFDGFEDRTNQIMRGNPNLLEEKLRALERLEKADLLVVLVPAVERGVNEHEVGAIVEFGIRHPAVFGVHFQSAFRAQRHIPADPMTRITIPDILAGLETQTDGLFTKSDFVPVPCCMPVCSFITYALLIGEHVTPLPRVLDVELYLDYIKNRTLPGLSEDILHTLERLWSSSVAVGSEQASADVQRTLQRAELSSTEGHDAVAGCSACQSLVPLSQHTTRDLGRHVFMVNIRDFMDPWTFNVKNVMKCCIGFLIPDGRTIPFCAYNSAGYREQVTAKLMQEREERTHLESLEASFALSKSDPS